MDVHIEPLCARHLEDAVRVERLCFSDGRAPEALRSELLNPCAVYRVLLADGRVCGYAGARAVADTADVTDVAVLPGHRGLGFGGLLMKALIRALLDRGTETLFLEVRESNAPARALYRGLGFFEISRRKDYYRQPLEDALVMALPLSSPLKPAARD